MTMYKLTIETEEENELTRVIKSLDITLSLWDLDQYLRSEIKYKDHSEEKLETLCEVREALHEILSEKGLSLDELVE